MFVLRETRRSALRHFLQHDERQHARAYLHVITGIAAIVLFGIALPAVVSYVLFLKVEKSAYLGIRLDYLYSIYIVFSVGVIIRYAALTWRALRGQPPDIEIGAGSAL